MSIKDSYGVLMDLVLSIQNDSGAPIELKADECDTLLSYLRHHKKIDDLRDDVNSGKITDSYTIISKLMNWG